MNKKEYQKKCKELFHKAESLGVELLFHPECFDYRRLNCLWYGGYLATVKVSDELSIELNIYGDVYADLFTPKGEHLVHVKDKGNTGRFGDEMHSYIKDDKVLQKVIKKNLLTLDYGNWVEYDGSIKSDVAEIKRIFIDLGMICDNILDDNILSAIDEVLDRHGEIITEILEVAETDYKILNLQQCEISGKGEVI